MFNILNFNNNKEMQLLRTVTSTPFAKCTIKGGKEFPNILGRVLFFNYQNEVLVYANIENLPISKEECATNIFAFHIHEGESCGGENFEEALDHFNPNNCPHPQHAGDLPPLFANKNGNAVMLYKTDRFTINQIIGKTMIIHQNVDDFTSQPSGNSGKRIACGIITKN